MSIHNMFSSRSKKKYMYVIIWILFLARSIKYLSQDKLIETFYLSSGEIGQFRQVGHAISTAMV